MASYNWIIGLIAVWVLVNAYSVIKSCFSGEHNPFKHWTFHELTKDGAFDEFNWIASTVYEVLPILRVASVVAWDLQLILNVVECWSSNSSWSSEIPRLERFQLECREWFFFSPKQAWYHFPNAGEMRGLVRPEPNRISTMIVVMGIIITELYVTYRWTVLSSIWNFAAGNAKAEWE